MQPLETPQPQHARRWQAPQVAHHLLLMVSVVTLMTTGFPIKYPDAFWAGYVVRSFGGFDHMLAVHKAAAATMVVMGILHLAYLGTAWLRGPRRMPDMMPRLQDVLDACQHIRYSLGLTRIPPRYGRYSYLEKFEYLAVFWGMVVMGGSGFLLWFPGTAAQVFPRWALDIARIIHSNEAFVALLSLVFGHFFAVHFDPKVFPASKVAFTGHISLKHMAEEHPLEFERLELPREVKQAVLAERGAYGPSRWELNLPFILLELAVYVTIFLALLVVFVPQFLA